MERKAIFVSPETHRKMKILSAELSTNMGSLIDDWVDKSTK